MNRERKAAAIAFAAIGLVAAIGWGLAYHFHVSIFEQRLKDGMSLLTPAIENRIGGFGAITTLLSEDVRIARALSFPEQADIPALNRRLLEIADKSGATQIFLLDGEGTVISSSNWTEIDTFPERDLSFRPYFIDAIRTGHGGYHAFSMESGNPGYFLSSRISLTDGKVGVIVIRFKLLPERGNWNGLDHVIALTDGSGIVVLASEDSWRYRPLQALPEGRLEQIADAHQYDGIDLTRLEPLFAPGEIGTAGTIDGETYMLNLRQVGPFGWKLIAARPFSDAQGAANTIATMLVLFGVIVASLVLIFLQHRQLVRIQNEQSVMLEQQVAQRTRELAEEVEIRRRTEKNLSEAESDLIQATKLAALGQMSAALVHEVSQPITALAAMLTATERRLEADETDNARNLLDRAQNLVQRIQHIIRHLRSFSKKDSGEAGRMPLVASIKSSLELVEPRAREIGVDIASVGLERTAEIIGSPVRLEQVLINLLLNALDAVAGRDPREVGIDLEISDTSALISVWDTGPGVPEGFAEKLAEPFFTTKSDGDGIGLGLTISQSILSDFGASMRFVPRDGGGTVCEVRLPLAGAPEKARAAE